MVSMPLSQRYTFEAPISTSWKSKQGTVSMPLSQRYTFEVKDMSIEEIFKIENCLNAAFAAIYFRRHGIERAWG